MEKSFVEISEYTDRDGNKDFFEHLGLFQQHKEYDVMTYAPWHVFWPQNDCWLLYAEGKMVRRDVNPMIFLKMLSSL